VLRWLGRTDDAVLAVEEALAVSAGEPKGFLGDSEPEWTAGLVLLEAGQAQRARDLLETAYGGPDLPLVMPAARTTALEALVDAELALGEVESAGRHAEAAARLVSGSALRQASAARSRAAVALAVGDPAVALEAVDAALDGLEGTSVVLEHATLLLASGRLRAATGDRESAVEHLERAEAVFTTAGAETRRAACAHELRKLGRRRTSAPRRPGAGPTGLAALTGREREVAELVATGETNRAIGRALFLSEKTVEAHLRNVFVKLGITSRAAVARALDRR
jgi:DNA-binding NarL/FixJ family response regulator